MRSLTFRGLVLCQSVRGNLIAVGGSNSTKSGGRVVVWRLRGVTKSEASLSPKGDEKIFEHNETNDFNNSSFNYKPFFAFIWIDSTDDTLYRAKVVAELTVSSSVKLIDISQELSHVVFMTESAHLCLLSIAGSTKCSKLKLHILRTKKSNKTKRWNLNNKKSQCFCAHNLKATAAQLSYNHLYLSSPAEIHILDAKYVFENQTYASTKRNAVAIFSDNKYCKRILSFLLFIQLIEWMDKKKISEKIYQLNCNGVCWYVLNSKTLDLLRFDLPKSLQKSVPLKEKQNFTKQQPLSPINLASRRTSGANLTSQLVDATRTSTQTTGHCPNWHSCKKIDSEFWDFVDPCPEPIPEPPSC
ncbi:hypothetical protein RFI_19390 [Reticulomyxa filosa]|uniref:Uncharacterized protein n=1 Tax=Reticulomyxa filosa TaxID=46433 RepID=X6MWC1_RETFI|nr:hypothetical protein RFI_19390 [Reticulomyxa filosa]|eukprot:ETO17916.1 hypothetical protein RFI_19390 [Reticulomyxa filosa]